MKNTAFAALMAFERETQALSAVAERLGWDQETMMPRGAAEQRGEEMAAMEGVLHARRTDPRIADWLAAARDEIGADPASTAQLRLIARAHARSVKVPAALAQELARVTSVAQGIWAEARATDDVAAFLPTLARVVDLRRQEAECLAGGGDLYDALMDDYEPGATAETISAMFGRMRPRLVSLRERVLGRAAPAVRGNFPAEGQLALAREVATAYGYDFTRGRLDLAVHPFSSGTGDDSRITTRVVESDPFNCLYSTIHEVGHSSYELNIDRALKLTPAGRGVSMGVHESQSRIYENQIGRGAMALWIFGRMKERFGDIGVDSAEDFLRAVNRVQSGFIRTEADEVHYNLHIMMRFDLERALIRGDLRVSDLEAAWNDRFRADFGVAVDRPSNGVLQDVHWSVGLFGYFPTYALGNVYAGCLWAALRRDLPGVEAALAAGDATGAVGWLKDRLQSRGGLLEPAATIEAACGFAPSEAPFLDYLDAKFAGLYGL